MRRSVAATAAVLALAGCQQPGATTVSPSTSATPVVGFPSLAPASPRSSVAPGPVDDVAMVAAANGFLEHYWAVVDDMRNSGGTPETVARLSEVATGQPLAYWTETARQWSANQIYSEGRYRVVSAQQQTIAVGDGKGTATFAYCVDTSTAEFRSRDPQGPVPSKRPERYRKGVATLTWVEGGWKYTDAQELAPTTC